MIMKMPLNKAMKLFARKGFFYSIQIHHFTVSHLIFFKEAPISTAYLIRVKLMDKMRECKSGGLFSSWMIRKGERSSSLMCNYWTIERKIGSSVAWLLFCCSFFLCLSFFITCFPLYNSADLYEVIILQFRLK